MEIKRLITVMVSPEEIEVLQNYTKTPKLLLNQMIDAINIAREKRKAVKRIKVLYVLEELDKIISAVAEEANKNIHSDRIQGILDNFFGRLAEKYNYHVNFNNLFNAG